jgi:P27 family predicted phage terminase small subunit
MRGRKKKPIEQAKREDNPGKRALPEPLRIGGPAMIEAPADLPSEGRALWEEIVPRLYQAGLLDAVDGAALKIMCEQWAIAERALKVVREEGYFTPGSTGQLTEHPALAIVSKAHASFRQYAEQFAMTPAARARIAAALNGTPAGDELEDIIDQEPEPL